MTRFSLFVVSLILAAFFGHLRSSNAAITFYANLTHDQEPGAPGITPTLTSTGDPRPLSYGTAIFVLNDAETEMSMSATIFNIDITGAQTPDTNDNLVAAHIHVGAPPGTNAGVRWGFFGAPDNDINPDNLVVTPFASGVGGTFTSVWNQPEGNPNNGPNNLTTSLPAILSGLSYINFHTVQFGGGEIRGQIVTPEPASLAIWGLGALGCAVGAYRRRRARIG